MGFKRTSEGRIYFQGSDEKAPAAKPAEFRSLTQNPGQGQGSGQSAAAAPAQTQFQILTLLKALNDKLKTSQAERATMRIELESYRKVIEDLENRAQRSEKSYQELEQKIRSEKSAVGKVERAEKLAEDTFKELQETRKLILELEEKTEKVDETYLTLQQQVEKARAIGDEVSKKQLGYDELVKRLDNSETRQDDLAQKIDNTAGEQSRLSRQIAKVAEDRTRFMRKIERIEETVIQTRDALSAKAMVLLTEQGTATGRNGDMGVLSPAPSLAEQVAQSRSETRAPFKMLAFPAWVKRPVVLQAAGVAGVMVAGVLGGLLVSEIQKSRTVPFEEYQAPSSSEETAATETETSSETETAAAQPEPAPVAQETLPPDIEAQENTGQFTAGSVETDGPVNPALAATRAADDIGTLDLNDEEKLVKMLGENPDALAAQLNKLEPADEPPTDLASAEQVAGEEPASGADEISTEENEMPLSEQDLRREMRPDTALPPGAQEIETQAYKGVPEAQHDLAAIYTAGQGGVKKDYGRAHFWFQQAAARGIANAAYNLGVLYHQGLGVKPDIKEAIRWYGLAAQKNHPEAQYNLGIAYIEGIGVSYDPEKAASNFEKAAKKGIVEAAYNLGLIYENGLLGKTEPDQALKWYKTAADQGSPEAKEALTQLAKTLDIKVEEVNRVADKVKINKPVKTSAPAAAKPSPADDHAENINPDDMTAQAQEQRMKSDATAQ